MIYRLHTFRIGGIFPLKSFHYYSTNPTASAAKHNQRFLEEYLINTLNFSRESAISASKKAQVRKYKSFKKDPNLVIGFFHSLDMNNTQIKTFLISEPQLLFFNVDKTLEPKVRFLQEIGLSGQDLVGVLLNYKSLLGRGLDAQIKPAVERLRQLLGSDETVVKAMKKCPSLLHNQAVGQIEKNVVVFENFGLSKENICRFILRQPRRFIQSDSEYFVGLSYRVENELGIPRHSKMFYHGLVYLSSFTKSSIEAKREVFRSFGWSDQNIYGLMRRFPSILGNANEKLRKGLSFYMKEFGYTPEFLSSNPVLLCLRFEKVKLRNEVMEVLNQMGLNKKKSGARVFLLSESKFLKEYLLPYKENVPHVYKSYVERLGKARDENVLPS